MTVMDEYQNIKDLLRPRRTIGASPHLRQRIQAASITARRTKHPSRWLCRGAAAACVALALGATLVFGIKSAVTPAGNSDCIVYVAGQQASGDEAQAVAEADVAKMEQFMLTVARQNAAEREKVNQFMQHQSQPK